MAEPTSVGIANEVLLGHGTPSDKANLSHSLLQPRSIWESQPCAARCKVVICEQDVLPHHAHSLQCHAAHASAGPASGPHFPYKLQWIVLIAGLDDVVLS